MSEKFDLVGVTAEETPLFYSAHEPGRDQQMGCIGHLRQDFGRSGKEFHTTWDDHCADLKTQAFKDEFDGVINTLREGVLKDRAAMSAYCYAHPQAKLNDGRDYNYGFKLKTDSHVYYLRCCTLRDDNSLFCYAYERGRLEKCFPTLIEAPAPKPTLAEKLEANKRKAAQQGQPDTAKHDKSKEV